MDVKGEDLLQLFSKSKLRNEAKTFVEPKFSLFIVNFKKLGFSAPLSLFLYFFSTMHENPGRAQLPLPTPMVVVLSLFVRKGKNNSHGEKQEQ